MTFIPPVSRTYLLFSPPPPIFPDPVFDYLPDEVQGKWPVKGELYRSSSELVGGYLFPEKIDCRRPGIQSDMVLVRREMHQVAIEPVRGYALPYRFFRSRGSLSDGFPEIGQHPPDLRREQADVLIDGIEFLSSRIHTPSSTGVAHKGNESPAGPDEPPGSRPGSDRVAVVIRGRVTTVGRDEFFEVASGQVQWAPLAAFSGELVL